VIKIIEVEYSCSPGGRDMFEVYMDGAFCDSFYDIADACVLAYSLANEHKHDIYIHTLALYHHIFDNEDDTSMSDPFATIPTYN
jgi:hypothetical protein